MVGDTTVVLGRFRDALSLRTEDGARLAVRGVRAIEPGTEVIERLTYIASCYRCRTAFFLPDFEVRAMGAPRLVHVPLARQTRQYMAPAPEPAHMAQAYATLAEMPRVMEDD
jgi:hypothetical protein